MPLFLLMMLNRRLAHLGHLSRRRCGYCLFSSSQAYLPSLRSVERPLFTPSIATLPLLGQVYRHVLPSPGVPTRWHPTCGPYANESKNAGLCRRHQPSFLRWLVLATFCRTESNESPLTFFCCDGLRLNVNVYFNDCPENLARRGEI